MREEFTTARQLEMIDEDLTTLAASERSSALMDGARQHNAKMIGQLRVRSRQLQAERETGSIRGITRFLSARFSF